MQHATTTSRPPGRCGPGEVSLIEVGRQPGSIVEGRFGAPPGDQLGPPSTVSETQSHKMGSAACEACRSRAAMPLRQHGCTPGHTRWQWNPVRYADARSLVSHSHSHIAASAGDVDVDGAGDYSTPVATLETTQKCMRSRTLRQFVGN